MKHYNLNVNGYTPNLNNYLKRKINKLGSSPKCIVDPLKEITTFSKENHFNYYKLFEHDNRYCSSLLEEKPYSKSCVYLTTSRISKCVWFNNSPSIEHKLDYEYKPKEICIKYEKKQGLDQILEVLDEAIVDISICNQKYGERYFYRLKNSLNNVIKEFEIILKNENKIHLVGDELIEKIEDLKINLNTIDTFNRKWSFYTLKIPSVLEFKIKIIKLIKYLQNKTLAKKNRDPYHFSGNTKLDKLNNFNFKLKTIYERNPNELETFFEENNKLISHSYEMLNKFYIFKTPISKQEILNYIHILNKIKITLTSLSATVDDEMEQHIDKVNNNLEIAICSFEHFLLLI